MLEVFQYCNLLYRCNVGNWPPPTNLLLHCGQVLGARYILLHSLMCRVIWHIDSVVGFEKLVPVLYFWGFTSRYTIVFIVTAVKTCYRFDVFSTVHHSIGLFLQPNLMHNSITTCMSHYYPRHVSGLDMPILRRNNCTNTASGILAVHYTG